MRLAPRLSTVQAQLRLRQAKCRTTAGISMRGVCDLTSPDVIQPCAWSLDSRQDRQKAAAPNELQEKYRIRF